MLRFHTKDLTKLAVMQDYISSIQYFASFAALSDKNLNERAAEGNAFDPHDFTKLELEQALELPFGF